MSLKERIMFKLFMRMVDKSASPFPAPVLDGGMVQDYDVTMRDGTTLATHVYFPNKGGEYPVILVRSPYVYGLDIQKLIFCHYIKYGFILCYQEVRGRGESGGNWQPFQHEASDTEDTLKWLEKQRFCTKGIALLGNSYLSAVHIAALDKWTPSVKTAFLPVYGDNLYDVAYQNGVLKEDFMLIWNIDNNSVKRLEPAESAAAYQQALKHTPRTTVMQTVLGGEVELFTKLLENPFPSAEYWQQFRAPDPAKINVPICLVTGWYDFSVNGQLRIYNGLRAEVREKSRLIIGPWNHALMNKGDLKATGNDITGVAALTLGLEWFLHIFYNRPLREEYNIKSYQINSGFKTMQSLPATTEKRYNTAGAPKTYKHNPAAPFATCGGGAMSPRLFPKKTDPKQYNALQPTGGDCARLELNAAEGEYFGEPELSADFSSTSADAIISARLCLKRGKKEYFLSSGIGSLDYLAKGYTAGQRVSVTLRLSPVSFTLRKGESLSVIISSADYPAYAQPETPSENTVHSATMRLQLIDKEQSSCTKN